MGIALCWLAIREAKADEVCAALKLERTGEFRGAFNSPYFAAVLPTGWYLVAGYRKGYSGIRDSDLAGLSGGKELVVCEVEEHVMHSSAACWRDGKQIWSVVHSAEKGQMHLDEEGVLPDAFVAIRTSCFDRQEEERKTLDEAVEAGDMDEVEVEYNSVDHIFDIPQELAKQLTGFRYDHVEVSGQEPKFETLRRKGWLARLLSR